MSLSAQRLRVSCSLGTPAPRKGQPRSQGDSTQAHGSPQASEGPSLLADKEWAGGARRPPEPRPGWGRGHGLRSRGFPWGGGTGVRQVVTDTGSRQEQGCRAHDRRRDWVWLEGLLEHPVKGGGGESKVGSRGWSTRGRGSPGSPPSQLWILGGTWRPKTHLVGRAPAHISAEDGQSWIGGQGDERETGGLDAQEAVGKESKSRGKSGHPRPRAHQGPGSALSTSPGITHLLRRNACRQMLLSLTTSQNEETPAQGRRCVAHSHPAGQCPRLAVNPAAHAGGRVHPHHPVPRGGASE